MGKDAQIKLSTILAKVKESLIDAVGKKTTGVAYMYVAGEKVLTVSVETIVVDENKTTEEVKAKDEVVKED